jgi:predicted GH43/DUF377 family glycosyl hydrolase
MIDNFSKLCLDNGGDIIPLIIPSEITSGTGITNPSIFLDSNKILLNIRHVGYSLYLCENQQKFQTKWGPDYSPFCYLHPEDDCTLRTINYLCDLDKTTYDIKSYKKVDTSKLDVNPVWDFIGLEDARLVRWDNRLFMCGVRRDTKTNGEGRMELSEIVNGVEVNRYRIEPPNNPDSYCEKNWMPIIDKPFHFVKWSNPTEVVKVDVNTLTSKTVYLSKNFTQLKRDIRGGSQVIKISDCYVALTHEVDLWNTKHNKKDGRYYHRFVVWDENFKIIRVSDEFSFMSAGVEFCCGMAVHNDQILMTFGYQDNASFLLKAPLQYIKSFLKL